MMASLGQGGADELVDYEEDEQQGVEGKDKGVVGGSTTVEDSVVGRGNYVAIHASGFRDFFLKPELVRAIGDAGFEHPSEVQHETIPHAITGADILCQAKSGMGKTAVFVLSILQQINIDSFGGGSGGLGGSGMGGGGASSGATGGGCVDGTGGVQSVVGGNSLGDNKNVGNSKDGVGGGISGQKSGGRGGTAVNGIGVAGGGGGAGSGTVNGTLVGGSNSGGGVSGSIIMGTGLGGVGSGSNNSVSVDSGGAGLGSSGVAGGVVGGGVGVGSNSSSAVGGILCLAIAHTRELAYQIKNEFERFSKYLKGVRCEVVYGGIPMSKNIQMLKDPKTCPHILIGTPGRVLALVQRKAINVSHIAHFVLDECDKCLEKTDMRRDVQDIFLSTGKKKQVMFFSATMNRDIRTLCRKFMQHPIEVFIDDESKLTLHGLLQYYIKLQESEKNRRLNDLLDLLEFNQVIIFVKSVSRAQALDALLTECNFPSFAIHAGLGQEERINRYQQFKNFEKRIMVATDLFGRGIDIERVNIVINYDMPDSSDAYLHRVGRAGRFGTKGLAITFVASQEDTTALNDVQTRFEVHIPEMPATIDASQYINQ